MLYAYLEVLLLIIVLLLLFLYEQVPVRRKQRHPEVGSRGGNGERTRCERHMMAIFETFEAAFRVAL